MDQNEGQKIAAKACIDEFRAKSEEFMIWLDQRQLQYENAKNDTIIPPIIQQPINERPRNERQIIQPMIPPLIPLIIPPIIDIEEAIISPIIFLILSQL